MNQQNNKILLLTMSNLLFPIIGFFLNSSYYLLSNLSSSHKRIIFFNVSFSFAFIGFIYVRSDNSGDLFRYGLSLYNYGQSLLNSREEISSDVYEYFYPTWYFLFYIVNKLNLNIQYLNFLAGFTIYSSFLYLILELDKKYKSPNADKMLFVKIFLFISFIAIFSSYKTLWAFSIVSVGLYKLINKEKLGYIFIFLGGGLHPIALFPIFIFFFSKYIIFRVIYLYISLIIGILLKSFTPTFNQFLFPPFIINKVNTYIHGDWGEYRFHDNSEYMKFFILVLFIIFIFYIISFKFVDINNSADAYFRKYNNFILWYFSISLWFIGFRTIETRLLLDGVIFFFPLFYQLFLYRKIYKKRPLSVMALIIWFIIIDFRTFNIFNNSYVIGIGFPFNLFESPIFRILQGVV